MKTSTHKIVVLIIIDIVFIIGVILFLSFNNNSNNSIKSKKKNTEINNKINKKNQSKDVNKNKLPDDYDKEKYDITDILKYEIKTSYYKLDKNKNKIYIDSEEELNNFYSLFDNKLNIDKYYLYNNTIYIQYISVGSSAIECKLNDVNFENNIINFKYDVITPDGIMTQDMAGWYLMAIIPNSKLTNIDTGDWIKPSTIKKDKYGNYN